ncbi:spermatogenesis-associated protein 31E1-like [Leopardus geoffroyi]|uniref:spermatogenesis-associated protein 31E1-like n=1 Tax=Leopardus geoffroyi TaxID=46844 RepID=UPI001E260686|nr:spermatogenesis-associated protein 31E1-like [Leopardus geoffroyi]
MENILFALRSISAGWLSSSLPSWTTQTIFFFLCGLSFFLLLISCFQTDPTSSAPRRKRRSSRKQVAPWRRSTRGKKSEILKAYRHCLQELEGVQDLVSLLRSHLGRLSDQGGLQQLLGQEAPGAKGKAAPARAHQPRGQPVRDAAPARAPPASPAPLASTLSPTPTTSSVSVRSISSLSAPWPPESCLLLGGFSPQPLAPSPSPPRLPSPEASPPPRPDSTLALPQFNSMARPLDAIPRSPSPHTPWVASASPAISGLGLSSCPISALSWWQAAAKAWSPSTSTRLESWQEPHSHQHPEASFWGGPGNRQAEASVLSFIGPDVQKLLEILITKRTELRFWKEKEKKEESDYHVNSLGSTFTSPRGGRDAVGYRSFRRSMKGEPQQLLGPEQPPYPKISGDNFRLKCSQLFWGLPILHSESLVATVSVTGPPLESPSVVFNDLSHALPSQIQAGVASHLSLDQLFSHPVAEPQALTPSLSQSQPPPPAQVEAQAHLAPSVPVGPPSLPPQMAGEASDPPIQNNMPSFIPNAIQNLEIHFLKKQLERNRTLPSVVKRSQEVFSQVLPDFPQDSPASQTHRPVSVLPFPSGDLTSPELQNHLEPHLGKRSTKQQGGGPHEIQPSVELAQPQGEPPKVPQAQSGSLQAAQTRSRGPARTTPGENLGKDAGPSVGRGRRDLHGSLISSSSKVSGINPEGSHTGLMKTSGPGQNHPEQLLRAHLGRKPGQITEGQIPASVHDSRLPASHGPDPPGKASAHRETGNPAFSKHPEPRVNIPHNFSILSPYTQKMLEAHIIRFRVRHRWGLPLKVLKPLNFFKLQKSSIFPPPSTPRSATRPPKAGAEARFLEKPPEPHQGEKVITEESVLTSGSPLLDPQPAREEIQRALGESPPGDGPRPSGAPVAGREAGLRPQTPAYSFVGRIWHSKTGAGDPQNSSLEASPARATDEPRRGSGGWTSRDPCGRVSVLELSFESRSSSAQWAKEGVGEGAEAPAWGDTLEPGVLANNQSVKPDVRRSGSSGSSQGPSTPPASVAQAQEEVEAQLEGFELQGSVESEEPRGPGRGVLLQDCETGVLLQDCATDDLLQDCHSDVLLAADVLASHRFPSGCQSESSTDTSTSWTSSPFVSHAQNSRGQPDPLRRRGLRSPWSKASVHADGREAYRRLSPGGREKWLAELKSFQASVMSHPTQDEDSAETSRSRFAQLLPKKEDAAPEGHLRKSVRHLLQWIFPSKGKGPEDPGHRGQPAAATAQTQGPVSGTSVEDGKSAGAQGLMTAVGRILEEKLVPRQGLRASEVNRRPREPQALAGTCVCYHRVLSYQEQRRVMRETACNLQAAPDGHGCPNENRWCRGRDGRWASVPRMPGSPDGPCHHGRMPARASGRPHRPHCPRHCLLQNYVSSGHSVCASHAFLGRTPFLQERMHTVQRKMYFSQVSTSSMG